MSTIDPECGFVREGRGESASLQPAYRVDRTGLCTRRQSNLSGSIHEYSQEIEDAYGEVTACSGHGEVTRWMQVIKHQPSANVLQEQEIRPVLPYTRFQDAKEEFLKHDYHDEHSISTSGPANAILSYETTNRAGCEMYRSNPAICCSSFPDTNVTESKAGRKRISRHVWAECVEEADHLLIYRRKQTDLRRAEKKP
ncbi:hypothetical protein P7H20_14760 [Paenibacillus larvae]|nr:hypothetical protein [Paenibacillus larvae]MDT2275834.1 hypothetical protein [Paenibacillus larvae]